MAYFRSLALAVSLCLSRSGLAEADRVEEHKTTISNGDAFRVNYALRDIPSGSAHGVGMGFKLYRFVKETRETEDSRTSFRYPYSGELAFDFNFGPRNMYSVGILGGSGTYSYNARRAFEVTGSLLRIAMITNPQEVAWNPSLGLELKVGSLTVCPSLQGYVGAFNGVGFGLNAGLSF